ncbi:MAG: DUF1330 domain-containing protein [Granulosicoccus sp.]
MAPSVFTKYGARFLARGDHGKTFEGQDWERHVVIELDSREQTVPCYNSAEYKSARKLRSSVCEANIVIMEGLLPA